MFFFTVTLCNAGIPESLKIAKESLGKKSTVGMGNESPQKASLLLSEFQAPGTGAKASLREGKEGVVEREEE